MRETFYAILMTLVEDARKAETKLDAVNATTSTAAQKAARRQSAGADTKYEDI